MNFSLQIHSNLSKTKMKFDFGYIWKMYIGGSFTKCKSEIPILIHVFLILMNEKVLPFLFSWWFPPNKKYHGIEKNQKLFGIFLMLKLSPKNGKMLKKLVSRLIEAR